MNQDYRGIPGVNYPANGKKWYQEDFQKEQDLIGKEILDREADFFSAGVITGWDISLSATIGCVVISAGKGRDGCGRRVVSEGTAETLIPDGAVVNLVARHLWIDEDYFVSPSDSRSAHHHSAQFIAVPEAESIDADTDIALHRVSRVGDVVTIVSDLRIKTKVEADAATVDGGYKPGNPAESGKRLVAYRTDGKIEANIDGDATLFGGKAPAQYADATHNHSLAGLAEKSYNSLTDKPTSMPANGGNSDTVGGQAPSAFATAGHNHALAGLSERSYNSLTDKPTALESTTTLELTIAQSGARHSRIDFHNADSPSDYTGRIGMSSGISELVYLVNLSGGFHNFNQWIQVTRGLKYIIYSVNWTISLTTGREFHLHQPINVSFSVTNPVIAAYGNGGWRNIHSDVADSTTNRTYSLSPGRYRNINTGTISMYISHATSDMQSDIITLL